MKALVAAAAVIALSGASVVGFGASRAADPAAQTVDNFELTDHTRLAHQLYYFGYAPAMLGVLDDDVSGKVEVAELKGRMGLALKARFADLDRNKDGGLDGQELSGMTGAFRRAQQETPDL